VKILQKVLEGLLFLTYTVDRAHTVLTVGCLT